MKRLNADIGAADAALQKAPKVFQSVGVNATAHITVSVIYDFMDVIWPQSLIGQERISTEETVRGNVLPDCGLQSTLAAIRNSKRPDFSATFQNAECWSLVLESSCCDNTVALGLVHETGRTTNERFVRLYFFPFSAKMKKGAAFHRKADAVHHKPSRLLRDSESAGNFVGANPVLRIHNEPNGNHPLVHAERGILKDGSHFDGELFLTILAEPNAPRGDERMLRRIAAWASDLAIRPAQLYRVVKHALRVREENNCFLQRLGKLECCVHG